MFLNLISSHCDTPVRDTHAFANDDKRIQQQAKGLNYATAHQSWKGKNVETITKCTCPNQVIVYFPNQLHTYCIYTEQRGETPSDPAFFHVMVMVVVMVISMYGRGIII